MSDYIKRTDAAEAFWRILNGMGISQKHNDRLVEEVDAVLDEYPAADVRPVVLCRDCKHWELSKFYPTFRVCTYVCGATFVRKAEDFCSRGEKMEES